MDNKIELKLTIDQLNVVLGGLARLPYEAVFMIIDEIQQQAKAQIPVDRPAPPSEAAMTKN
jgi:hypothetical protein